VARSSQRAKDAVARVDLGLDVELVAEAAKRVESAEGQRAVVWRRTRRVSCGWETGLPCARMRSRSWSAAAGRPVADSSEARAWKAGKQ
jgi:hypothetical protein